MRKAKQIVTTKPAPSLAFHLDGINFGLAQADNVLTTVYEEIGAEGWDELSETPRRLSVLMVVITMLRNEREQLKALILAQSAKEVSRG